MAVVNVHTPRCRSSIASLTLRVASSRVVPLMGRWIPSCEKLKERRRRYVGHKLFGTKPFSTYAVWHLECQV